MIGRAATSAARRVSSLLDPRRVCSAKSRPSDRSIQRKPPSYMYRDPSLWTRLAPIPPDQYYAKRTEEYEESSLQASSSHHKTNIFVGRYVHSRYVMTPLSFGDDDGIGRPKYSITHPFPFLFTDPGVEVDSCNGLLCHAFGDYLVVWNPTTMEVRKLPNSPSTELATGRWRMKNHYIACWVDSESEEDDYKVIRFFYYVDDVDDDEFYDPVEIELYSLKTDSWKIIPCCVDLTSLISPHYENGAVYWSHYDSERDRYGMMSFDLRSESFSTLPIPPLGGTMSWWLVRCTGQLSGLSYKQDHYHPCSKKVHWVMRNGAWVRLCGYRFSQGLDMPLGFARNGEVVLFQRFFQEPKYHYVLMAFDSITGELKQVPGFASRTSLEVFEIAQTFVKLKSSFSSSSASASGEQGGTEDNGVTTEAVM